VPRNPGLNDAIPLGLGCQSCSGQVTVTEESDESRLGLRTVARTDNQVKLDSKDQIMPITTEDRKSAARLRELCPLLFVRDIQRSIDFYCQMLGFKLARQAESEGKVFWCRLERDGCSLMLQQAEAEDGPGTGRGRGVIFYFICDDVDRMHAELTSRGLSLAAPETAYYGMRQVMVPEPDGYSLCFESPINEA